MFLPAPSAPMGVMWTVGALAPLFQTSQQTTLAPANHFSTTPSKIRGAADPCLELSRRSDAPCLAAPCRIPRSCLLKYIVEDQPIRPTSLRTSLTNVAETWGICEPSPTSYTLCNTCLCLLEGVHVPPLLDMKHLLVHFLGMQLFCQRNQVHGRIFGHLRRGCRG